MLDRSNDEHKIIKGRALPARRANIVVAAKYPLARMEVGDCFEVTASGIFTADRYGDAALNAASSRVAVYGRRNGKKFTCRKLAPTVLCIWRVA